MPSRSKHAPTEEEIRRENEKHDRQVHDRLVRDLENYDRAGAIQLVADMLCDQQWDEAIERQQAWNRLQRTMGRALECAVRGDELELERHILHARDLEKQLLGKVVFTSAIDVASDKGERKRWK